MADTAGDAAGLPESREMDSVARRSPYGTIGVIHSDEKQPLLRFRIGSYDNEMHVHGCPRFLSVETGKDSFGLHNPKACEKWLKTAPDPLIMADLADMRLRRLAGGSRHWPADAAAEPKREGESRP